MVYVHTIFLLLHVFFKSSIPEKEESPGGPSKGDL